jgi:hypothetical protein
MAKKNTAPHPNPLPLAGEGTELRVAYHSGPGEIGFCGNHWQRDVAQPITQAEWNAMRLRADFGNYDFKEETQT